MHRKGHTGIALLFATVLIFALPVSVSLPSIAVMIFFEPLPDRDYDIPVIAHRGYSHTLLGGITVATAICGVIAGGVYYTGTHPATLSLPTVGAIGSTTLNPLLILWFGIVLGFVAHLTGDGITNGTGRYGIQPFQPLSEWEPNIQLCRADNGRYNIAFLLIGVVTFIGSLYLKSGSIPL